MRNKKNNTICNCFFLHFFLVLNLEQEVGAQTNQAQKKEQSQAGERSNDKYGALIHSLALASISLHLSAVTEPQHIKANSKCRRSRCLFLSV